MLGVVNAATDFEPREIATGYTTVTVGGGSSSLYQSYACALANDSTVWCWGGNSNGQLGHEKVAGRVECEQPSTCYSELKTVEKTPGVALSAEFIEAGDEATTCALSGEQVYCWGNGAFGQVGPDSAIDAQNFVPTLIEGTPPLISDLSVGTSSVCVASQGAAWCWGLNEWGQLGNGALGGIDCGGDCATTPEEVIGSEVYVDVAAGVDSGFGATVTGQVFAWGLNARAALGHAKNTNGDMDCDNRYCQDEPVLIEQLNPGQ